MPPSTTSLLVEVGCSNRDTMDQEELPALRDAFLFSFEPLIDKYATLLARGDAQFNTELHNKKMVVVNDRFQPLGHHHRRGVVLPIAVAPSSGSFAMNVSRLSGCSSLMPFASETRVGMMGSDECRAVMETRVVPALSLAKVLKLMPPDLPIHTLKLDVQGLDFAIIRATPPAQLERVRSIHLEVLNDHIYQGTRQERQDAPPCPRLYERQPFFAEVKDYMRSLGLRYEKLARPGWMGPLRCEGTAVFSRTTVGGG